MKITINQLRKIIREEVERNLSEAPKKKGKELPVEDLVAKDAYMNRAGGMAYVQTTKGKWYQKTPTGFMSLEGTIPDVTGWGKIEDPKLVKKGGNPSNQYDLHSGKEPVKFEVIPDRYASRYS